MSPEVIRGEKYDAKADVWSACAVVYIMLSGKPPFLGAEKEDVYRAVKEDELGFPEAQWKGISQEAKDFLLTGMQKKQELRPTSKFMLDHAWLSDESMEIEGSKLAHVVKPIQEFFVASPFQKSVLSIMTALKIQ